MLVPAWAMTEATPPSPPAACRARFQPGKYTAANLKLIRGEHDADEDGVPASGDCNDNNSAQSTVSQTKNAATVSTTTAMATSTKAARAPAPAGPATRSNPQTRGLGQCTTDGTQACDNGTWATCQGTIGPAAAEACGDGIDNNCNGSVDENCPCTTGSQRYCFNTQKSGLALA